MRHCFVNVFATMLVLLTSQSNAFALRFVPIEVRLHGVVLLKGYDSDSGHRDFDQVWNNLHTVHFETTDEFQQKYVKPDTKEVVLECTNTDANEPDLVLDESFGGMIRLRKLLVHRVEPDRFGMEWMLDKDQLNQLFYERGMPRDRARELTKPKGDRVQKPSDGKKRNVRISVTSKDVLLLEGTNDDDGSRDADAIWDNLPNVRLKASDAFLKNHVKAGSTIINVDCTISVDHGGRSRNTIFHIVRVKPDEDGREWMLDPNEIKKQFEWREVTREQVTQLKDPGRSRFRR